MWAVDCSGIAAAFRACTQGKWRTLLQRGMRVGSVEQGAQHPVFGTLCSQLCQQECRAGAACHETASMMAAWAREHCKDAVQGMSNGKGRSWLQPFYMTVNTWRGRIRHVHSSALTDAQCHSCGCQGTGLEQVRAPHPVWTNAGWRSCSCTLQGCYWRLILTLIMLTAAWSLVHGCMGSTGGVHAQGVGLPLVAPSPWPAQALLLAVRCQSATCIGSCLV